MGISFFYPILTANAAIQVRSTDNMVEPVFVTVDERCVALKVWYWKCYLNLLYGRFYKKEVRF